MSNIVDFKAKKREANLSFLREIAKEVTVQVQNQTVEEKYDALTYQEKFNQLKGAK